MTATSYESHLAVTAGLSYSNLVFKANFNSSFTSANKVSSNTSFVKTLISIGKQREYISLADISLDDLKKYTTGSFAKNINDPAFPAVQVLTTYGTHVLLDIELGGRMELNYMYNNANQISESELSTSASGAYKGVSASGSLNLSSEAKSFYSNSQFTASQLGGTATANITSLEKAQAAYGTWSQSLEDGSSVLEFIGAGDLSNPYAMLPVWYLAESQERRAEIETAYIALLDANGK